MTASTSTTALHDLARQVERLSPNWTRPDRFYDRRGEIAERLRELAQTIERERRAS